MTASGRNLSRRRFVLSGAALTFAARSAAADDLVADDVEIDGPALPGYRAQPAGTGPFPCVVLVGDAGGKDWTAGMCRRLAGAGYLAVAPESWTAPQDPSAAESERMLDRAIAWAGQNGGDAQRVGLVGFGRGGQIAWQLDTRSAALKAVVVWGGAVGPDMAAALNAPLLGLYGKNDPAAARTALLTAESKAQAAGKTAQMVVYVGAGPHFAAGDGPVAEKAAALDGWDRMLTWFRTYGVV